MDLGQPQIIDRSSDLALVRALAHWLDDYYIDPLLGFFFPGVGDLASSVVGTLIVRVAVRQKLPPVVIARMLLNLAIDALVGAIPFAGDLFDIGWKANRRNLALLEARHPHSRGGLRDWLIVLGASLLFLGALAVPIAVIGWGVARLLE